MWYVVSDVFENVYCDEDFSVELQKFLFERVWFLKVEFINDYLKYFVKMIVFKEMDCVYKCFWVNVCRVFFVQCIVNWNCEKYDCEVYCLNVF